MLLFLSTDGLAAVDVIIRGFGDLRSTDNKACCGLRAPPPDRLGKGANEQATEVNEQYCNNVSKKDIASDRLAVSTACQRRLRFGSRIGAPPSPARSGMQATRLPLLPQHSFGVTVGSTRALPRSKSVS